jgi:hypothetical protein
MSYKFIIKEIKKLKGYRSGRRAKIILKKTSRGEDLEFRIQREEPA